MHIEVNAFLEFLEQRSNRTAVGVAPNRLTAMMTLMNSNTLYHFTCIMLSTQTPFDQHSSSLIVFISAQNLFVSSQRLFHSILPLMSLRNHKVQFGFYGSLAAISHLTAANAFFHSKAEKLFCCFHIIVGTTCSEMFHVLMMRVICIIFVLYSLLMWKN